MNLLEEFYNDPKRMAYTFQNYVFLTRVLQVRIQCVCVYSACVSSVHCKVYSAYEGLFRYDTSVYKLKKRGGGGGQASYRYADRLQTRTDFNKIPECRHSLGHS